MAEHRNNKHNTKHSTKHNTRHNTMHDTSSLDDPPQKKATKTFLDLPAEMRNEIYRAALTRDTERYEEGNLICFGDCKTPALLQVCHQIRDEASGIYYGENTFFHLGFFKFEACYGCMQYGKGQVRYVDEQVRKATGEGISLLSGFKVKEWELQEG